MQDLGQFPVAMTDIDAPHACRAIDQATAGMVGHIDALSAFDEAAGLGADRARNRPGLHEVLLSHGIDASGGIVVEIIKFPFGRHISLPFGSYFSIKCKILFYNTIPHSF
jgi:hypothetical protein